MSKADIAKILLDSGAVTLRPGKPFRYASGILSPIYCDNRILISLPDKRELIRDSFAQAIKEHELEFDIVAGTATAGIPHAAWLSEKLSKPMIYVRQSVKAHGKQNSIEGILPKGDRVLIIEDLISTGGSSIAAVKAVKAGGGTVVGCISIFTYEMKKAKKAFKEVNCPVFSLTTFSTLVNAAKETGSITEDEEKAVLEWNKDPESWGRKMGFE